GRPSIDTGLGVRTAAAVKTDGDAAGAAMATPGSMNIRARRGASLGMVGVTRTSLERLDRAPQPKVGRDQTEPMSGESTSTKPAWARGFTVGPSPLLHHHRC